MRTKVEFTSNGNTLAGLLQTPDSAVRCYALFAHCFTCGKDILAASRIATALNLRGIAVLRFDFTGLGNSDGDFANTNFSSNTRDLLAAVAFLRQHYQAPALLIGHSLGGAAVLAMADKVPEATAVVTIGAPWEPTRIMHNFAASLEEINATGEAEITLGHGQFRIKKQFLDDLQSQGSGQIGKLRKALLVMHSPQDETVPLVEAEKIYVEAKHPKSFISLDQADHLLSNKQDSDYVAEVIAGWASRYLPESARYSMDVSKGHVLIEEKNQKFTQHVSTDSHYWLADEPTAFGGDNAGPDPYEHLLAALGACTSMTLRLYANRKKLSLENVQVELNHRRCHEKDIEGCEQHGGALEIISRKIRIEGDLSPQQRQRLLEIADRCPVHKTLHHPLRVVTEAMESD